MIRAVLVDSEDESKKTIFLGISAGNVDRLVKGNAIYIKGETINMPGTDILIGYADTQAEMYSMLKDRFGLPEADKIHIE